jgi:leucyl aminopeptidase
MSQRFSNNPWRDFLPASFDWLTSKLKVEFCQTSDTCKLILVPCVDGKDGKVATVGGSFPAKAEVQKQVELHQWTGGGAFHCTADGRAYAVVSTSSVKTSSKQLARDYGMQAQKALGNRKISCLGVVAPEGFESGDIFEGLAYGFYDTDSFRSKSGVSSAKNFPSTIQFWGVPKEPASFAKAKATAEATTLTTFLQDAPPNWLDTTRFAEIASDLCKDLGVKCKVLGDKELEKEGCHLYLSVSKGSVCPAQMIVMEVAGKDSGKTRAIIGKGLTFDAGGTSLKPSKAMEEMKYDMSGGAAIMGSIYLLAKVQPATNVVGLIGCAENMPGSNASKPSDLIRARNGKTVEILNTDAEGRLVLADTINYAATEYKPEFMINAATLTGSVLHALGHNGAAVMSNDQKLADRILKVADAEGEPTWQLPLWPEIGKEIKSPYGDLQNIAKPGVLAGAIIGGIFLREFVEDLPWAHLDIAGAAWQCKATGFPSNGGSAYAVRTISGMCLS